MPLMGVEGFLEHLFAPRLLAFESLDRDRHVLDRLRLLMRLVADYRFQRGVDLQSRLTAGALDLDQLAVTFCHTANLSALSLRPFRRDD